MQVRTHELQAVHNPGLPYPAISRCGVISSARGWKFRRLCSHASRVALYSTRCAPGSSPGSQRKHARRINCACSIRASTTLTTALSITLRYNYSRLVRRCDESAGPALRPLHFSSRRQLLTVQNAARPSTTQPPQPPS